MSTPSQFSVWLEYFFFAGIILGQVLAFVAGLGIDFFSSSDEFPVGLALTVWAIWLVLIALFVRSGIRDSVRRKPLPDSEPGSGPGSRSDSTD
jgi:hypothetical protein